ncbi:MAG: ParA family protein [Microlunatus sp.]|nr:ParA family protein [Microlunatus sp.]
MAELVVTANPAGSTAKSTVAAALAHLAAASGQRVLVWDLDPQANLTEWLGGRRDTAGITQALTAAATNDPDLWPGVPTEELAADLRRQLVRTVQHTAAGVDLVAGDLGLRATARRWTELRSSAPELLLAEAVAAVEDSYDLLVLDSKGDLGSLTEAALRARGKRDDPPVRVLGVATPTTKALGGLTLLASEVRKVAGEAAVEFAAVVPVQIRPRNRGADADDLYAVMRETYPALVTPPVRGASSLDAACTAGEPITMYAPDAGVSADLGAVWADLRRRGVLP